MSDEANERVNATSTTGTSRLGRMLRIVLILFALAVGGIVVAAWYAGDRSDLEMEYEGFD